MAFIKNTLYPGHASIKVALCQVYTEQWDAEGNLKRALEALGEAARQGADLAITPECVLHGYADRGKDFEERLSAAAQALDSETVETICLRSAGLGMDTVFGLAEKKESLFHNSALLISADGEITSVYRKVHCRPFEDIQHQGLFTAGDSFQVLQRNRPADYNLGLMICFDREIPESVRSLRALGAELIACPLATDTWRMDTKATKADNEMLTRIRAAENEVFIAVVNHAGRFNGGSFIVGPLGEVLHQMDEKPGVDVVEVPVAAVRAQYHSQPLGWMGWGFRRPAVYRKYLD